MQLSWLERDRTHHKVACSVPSQGGNQVWEATDRCFSSQCFSPSPRPSLSLWEQQGTYLWKHILG